AGRPAVHALPAVTSEERPTRDLPLHHPRNADVVHEPDDVWPRIHRRGRAKWSVELFDHLRLALEDENVRAPERAHVQRLVTRVQDQYLLHGAEKCSPLDGCGEPRPPIAPWPGRRPPAPRARAP